MTNAQIIFNNSVKLMEEGILKGSGRFLTMVMEDGTKKEVEEPEVIHTYSTWKKLGFQVKKGQKAIASFTIWKYAERTCKDEEGNAVIDQLTGQEAIDSSMFMKKASFFTADQVEKIA